MHVSICTGNDHDGGQVKVTDSLCLNRPAVELLSDNMSICVQQQTQYSQTIDDMSYKLQAENHAFRLAIAGDMILGAIVLLCIWAISRMVVRF